MTETNLTFKATYTVSQFKDLKGINEVRVLQNPKTNKVFMSWVGGTGAVSAKGIPTISPVISLVISEKGEEFYLLHEEGCGGVPTLAVL